MVCDNSRLAVVVLDSSADGNPELLFSSFVLSVFISLKFLVFVVFFCVLFSVFICVNLCSSVEICVSEGCVFRFYLCNLCASVDNVFSFCCFSCLSNSFVLFVFQSRFCCFLCLQCLSVIQFHQPSTSNHQPATNNQQPTTSNHQPII